MLREKLYTRVIRNATLSKLQPIANCNFISRALEFSRPTSQMPCGDIFSVFQRITWTWLSFLQLGRHFNKIETNTMHSKKIIPTKKEIGMYVCIEKCFFNRLQKMRAPSLIVLICTRLSRVWLIRF